ncbi:glucuronate isomerase [uncultured Oscillibacter sp.]|uniref:glucuronate isomerase n=1 Tax=uncultured Oscillibacter sp. TaxID=876091 RepID=UPI00266F19B4|nr:glucuronate isomerase [uncultured Oscillibacter sp.]
MRHFMDEDFLLHSDTAKALYHRYAKSMPIVDYHCHIDPADILADKRYNSITEVWLGGDHYKWRAMRCYGVPEYYITGNADPADKFQKWAETVPQLVGNPLYHWTHLELKRYFGITEPLTAKNAGEIYRHCNNMLTKGELSVRGIIRQSNVKLICTTDDPVDSLEVHQALAKDSPAKFAAVLPAFRPDKAMRADKTSFPEYVKKLESVVGCRIDTMDDMRRALVERIAFFHERNCRVSDHALDACFYVPANEADLNQIFSSAKAGKPITKREYMAYHTALLLTVAREYHRLGWVMQLHFGCLRDNSYKMFSVLGPDTGFDSINDAPNAEGLVRLLSKLEQEDILPKTILYSLNPADNSLLNTLAGAFQTDGGIPGKIQQGAAWWFNDHKSGIQEQLVSFMNLGVISTFNGMLTDSRSFLSYTRHEYFRRILCDVFGKMVEDGEYPTDMDELGRIVENISYYNALCYFGFDKFL